MVWGKSGFNNTTNDPGTMTSYASNVIQDPFISGLNRGGALADTGANLEQQADTKKPDMAQAPGTVWIAGGIAVVLLLLVAR